MKDNILKDQSFLFAIRIVELNRYLQDSKKEWVLSKQILRSGTSIGAWVREAEFAQSKADFISKMSIALKEANEMLYWLELLHASKLIDDDRFSSYSENAKSIISILVKSIKTSKELWKGKNEKWINPKTAHFPYSSFIFHL